MKKVIVLNKKEGQTPLQALQLFRRKNKKYQDSKMTYAGRLDPMASGLLLILVDEKTKDKEKFLSLDKEYNFEILFGFATDTHDILGRIEKKYLKNIEKESLEKSIKNQLKDFKGKIKQKYPAYSSKTVKGKPLFYYARKGEDIEPPERLVEIKKIKFLKIKKIKGDKLKSDISKRINKVKGDFRQKEIKATWSDKVGKKESYFIASFNIKCSSGTYVRVLANTLGQKIKMPTLAYKIERIKIGEYKIKK
jgi:tRNA pseudouridine55 synthase